MHELSLISSIFDIILKVAAENNLKHVSKVVLKIGGLRQVVPSMLEYAFAITAKDTIAKKATLEIVSIPIKMHCFSCEKEFVVEEHIFLCGECGSSNLKMLQGDELIVETIEGEQ